MLTLKIHLIYYLVVLELQYPSFEIFTQNKEETHPPKDVKIKREEIQNISEDMDLDDDKWWCDKNR
ncbi:hypothetical protein Hanom_Chr07g00670371 [Helianthus anomalus]